MGLAVVLLIALTAAPADQPILEIDAAAPLDRVRLADAVRVYLDDRSTEVRVATGTPAASTGAAHATVTARVLAGGEVELEVRMATTGERVLMSLPRPVRDADLYRTLALKVHTLLPAREVVQVPAPRARLTDAGRPSRRSMVEASAIASSFPLGGAFFAGGALRGVVPFGQCEIGAQLAAVLPSLAHHGGVNASVHYLPLRLAVNVRPFRGRAEATFGVAAELAYVRAVPSSDTMPVAPQSFLVPSVGGEAGMHVAFLQRWSWFMRADALAVVYGARLTVQGQQLLDLSRVQIGLSTGIATSWW